MRAVVFSDVVSGSLRASLTSTVQHGYPNATYVDVSGGHPNAFLAAWHDRYGGAAQPSARRQAELDSIEDCLVCYVTESKTAADADVAYALFVAEVPTLTLTPCEPLSPLLHSAADSSEAAVAACLRAFFAVAPTAQAGEAAVVVMEGGDGAGKETQTALLVRRMVAHGTEVHTLDFPHERGLYGGLVRVVLSGKKGSISELDPQLFSFLYSLNRFGSARLLRFWLRRGSAVVLDRYYTANFGHQASKLPPDQREAFIDELEFTEVGWLRLPRATAVLYLDLPPAAALEAMRHDTTRKQLDIHETAGGDYKERVRQTYMWCCEHLPGWHRVACFDGAGNRLTREEVHAAIVDHLGTVHSRAVGGRQLTAQT